MKTEPKKCSRCGKTRILSPEYWYKNKATKDGYDYYCKWCRDQATSQSRISSPEEKKLRKKEIYTGINFDDRELKMIEEMLEKLIGMIKIQRMIRDENLN